MAPLQVPNGSFSQFGPIWRPMALPYGHSGPGKWSQHITLDVPSPDPTFIHTDPPVCSRQGGVWPQKDHLWLFWAVFGHKMSQNGSKWLVQEWLPLDHYQTQVTQPHGAYAIIGFHKIATVPCFGQFSNIRFLGPIYAALGHSNLGPHKVPMKN